MIDDFDIDNIFSDPHKFGLPTLEEFQKNPDLWRVREDDKLIWADKGSSILNKYVSTQEYEFSGYRCKSLEELERVVLSEGYKLSDLEFQPHIIPDVGRKCKILVRFRINKSNNGAIANAS